MLACRDPEWREEKRIKHSGSVGVIEALNTPVITDAGND
jgi:hypothetical protein